MAGNDPDWTRRSLLGVLGGTGVLMGVAGCSSLEQEQDASRQGSTRSRTTTATEHETQAPTEPPPPSPSASVEVNMSVTEGASSQLLVVSGRATATRGIDLIWVATDEDRTRVQVDGVTDYSFETELYVRGGRAYELDITVVDTTGAEFTDQHQTRYVPIYIDPIETNRVVGAHYYPWYETEDHQNWTSRTVSNPVLGEYAASDRSVIDHHLKWSLEHGIGWWSISWWGPDSPTDRVLTERILTAEQFDRIQFSILYETVGRFEEFNYDLDDERARARLADDFAYFERTFFERDNYRRVNGRPVVYFYVSGAFEGDVKAAFENATVGLSVDPYILAGIPFGTPPSRFAISLVADAVTSYAPYTARSDIEDIFLDRYERGNKVMHLGAEVSDIGFVPVVMPGYNATGQPDVDADGRPVLTASPNRFERVCEQVTPHLADAEGVLITSFNEWYENTQVEPNEEYDEAYLELTAGRLATSRSSGFDPAGKQLRFVFNKTVQPANVNPDSSDHRELAFMANRLSFHDASEQVASYDIGVPDEEPLWLKGVFGPESRNGRTWRWWGGPAAETILFAEGRSPDVKSAVLTGQPMVSNEIEADVFVDGTRTDHVAFGERGGDDNDYDLSLTAP